MADRDDRGRGIRSPAFARLMLLTVPVGVMFTVMGIFQPMPQLSAHIITGIGVFVVIYGLIVSGILWVLRKHD